MVEICIFLATSGIKDTEATQVHNEIGFGAEVRISW